MTSRDENKPPRRELPMAEAEPEFGNGGDEGWTYIAYGERGEDVAFEISNDLQEALEIYQSMQEDGFAARLYQAHELTVVADESPH